MKGSLLLVFVLGAWVFAPAQETVQKEALRAKADPAIPLYRRVDGVSGSLVSFGTNTMDDLMKAWIAGFTAIYPKVGIDLESKASMSVPAALTAGSAQLAPLSRELNPSEVQAFEAKYGYAPTEVRVALGSYRTPTRTVALTFYVNAANPLAKVDFAQLDAMWCTTRKRGAAEDVTRWGQLGLTGEWADRPIHLVGVLPPDGVPNFISRLICEGGPLREGIYTEKNAGTNSVLTRIVEDVAKDPEAIGYAGFHNQLPGTKRLRIAANAKGPYYEGTFEEVRTARYPMTRSVYIYVDRKPGEALQPAVGEFLRYVLSRQGQKAVEDEGIFMPLPARIAAEELRKLR